MRVVGLGDVDCATGVNAVSASGSHTLALKNDGTVWAWGNNRTGELGDGTDIQRGTPAQVLGLNGIVDIAAAGILVAPVGSAHVGGRSFAARADGSVFAWGANDAFDVAHLGDLTRTNRLFPVNVLGLEGNGYLGLQKTDKTPDTFVFANRRGVAPGATVVSAAVTISGITVPPAPISIASVPAGAQYSVNGNPFTNAAGAVSNGDKVTVQLAASASFSASASATVTIGGVSADFVVNTQRNPAAAGTSPVIAAGDAHTALARSDGTLWGWGYNGNGQIGNGSTLSTSAPQTVSGLGNVLDVAAGQFHTLARKSDRTLWASGWNGAGQIGDGTAGTPRLAPVPVTAAFVNGVETMAAGTYHSVAVDGAGSVWTWGSNTDGQLGNGTNIPSFVPVKVAGLTGIIAVAAGERHTLALSSSGALFAWGDNSFGQLGDGTTISRNTPQQIALNGVTRISAGARHTLVLRTDGSVWAWGDNSIGQLGDGSIASRSGPAVVPGLTSGVTAIAAGQFHSIAVKAGQLYVWGNNANGQVGDSGTATRLVPFAVPDRTDIVAVAGGARHTVALSSTNVLYAFGDNTFGQVGNRSGNYNPHGARMNVLRGDVDISDVTVAASTAVGLASSTTGTNASSPGNWGPLVFPSQAVNTLSALQTVNFFNDSFDTNIPNAVFSASPPFVVDSHNCPIPPNATNPTIPPRATCQVQLKFTPTQSGDQVGEFKATWHITDSNSQDVTMETNFPLQGTGSSAAVPVITVSAPLVFANQSLTTTSAAQTITIGNTGTASANLSTLTITGAHSGDFILNSTTCVTGTGTLAAGVSCTASVSFAPTLTGTRTAALSFTSSNASNGSSFSVALSGTGANPVTLTVVKAGTGTGTIISSPAGINCTPTCSASFAAGSTVTLTTTPAAGSVLGSWTGCDMAVGTTCTISSLAAPRSVTATFNQSTQRAFVSATGNDANTATLCAVTAPCKTFKQAVTVVADNGEVVALNTAPYGSVTLTRSISLTAAPGVYAGISVFAGSGVTIASPGISVVLRGLTINGQGGANGILVDTPATGAKLSIENCVIANFANAGGAGVAVNAPAQLRVVNTLIRDSFDGISIAGGATAVITGSKILENSDTGILVNGASATVINTVVSASGTGIAAAASGTANIAVTSSAITNNGTGVIAQGTSTVTLTNSMVTGNTLGLSQAGASTLELTGNNTVRQNATPTSGTITTAPRM